MNDMVFAFPGGRKRIVATSITLVSATALTVNVVVPVNTRWQILSLKMNNCDSVIRDTTMNHYATAAKTIELPRLANKVGSLVNADTVYPNATTGSTTTIQFPALVVLDGYEDLEFTWSAGIAGAGGTKDDGLVIEYLEVMQY